MNLQQTTKNAALALAMDGPASALKVLKTLPGISFPDGFEKLPDQEQRRRIKQAIAEAQTKSGIDYEKTYSSLDELYQAGESDRRDITGQALLNGGIKMTDELREQIITAIAERVGGREKTQRAVYSVLRYGKPKHWALERFQVVKYGDGPARISYCAGQDQTWEMRDLRNTLKK